MRLWFDRLLDWADHRWRSRISTPTGACVLKALENSGVWHVSVAVVAQTHAAVITKRDPTFNLPYILSIL